MASYNMERIAQVIYLHSQFSDAGTQLANDLRAILENSGAESLPVKHGYEVFNQYVWQPAKLTLSATQRENIENALVGILYECVEKIDDKSEQYVLANLIILSTNEIQPRMAKLCGEIEKIDSLTRTLIFSQQNLDAPAGSLNLIAAHAVRAFHGIALPPIAVQEDNANKKLDVLKILPLITDLNIDVPQTSPGTKIDDSDLHALEAVSQEPVNEVALH